MNPPKYHPLAFVAFLLAVFVLIWPTQAGLVTASLRSGELFEATLIVVLTVDLVAAPLIIAEWNTRRHPERWKPRFLTRVTWGIIVLNLALKARILANFIAR
jgi:hypothetical protein